MPFSPLQKHRAAQDPGLEEWLISPDPAEQELAAETLFEMGSSRTFLWLMAVFTRESRSRTRRATTGGLAAFLFACVVAVIMCWIPSHHFPTPLFLMINPVVTLAARPSKLLRKVSELIAELTNVQALPVIINVWRFSGFADVNVPAQSLIRLLPKLTSADIAILDKAQWTFVLSWLSPRASKQIRPEVHSDLIRAILLTCGNLGITEALPRVKRLAEGKSPKPEIQQLQQTARNYVTLLENTTNTSQMVVRR